MDIERLLLLTVGCVNYDCDINFYEPLKEMCPTVIRYNYLERCQQIGKRAMNRELLRLVKAEEPDCVFFHTYQERIYKSTIKRITDSGVTTIGWFSDDHWRFEDYSRKWAPYLNYCVTTDKESFLKYRSLGYPAILSQWAANPNYYKPYPLEKIYDVSFVGQCHGIRREVTSHLISKGVSLKTFGRGWGEYIPFADMVKIYSQSRINLNISASSVDSSVKQVKGRIFEVPMAGGFLLTDYAPELENFFTIGEELVCYEGLDDAVEKIRYYLAHEGEREQIAQAGHKRALEQHTWQCRLADVLEEAQQKEGVSPSRTWWRSLIDIWLPVSLTNWLRTVKHRLGPG